MKNIHLSRREFLKGGAISLLAGMSLAGCSPTPADGTDTAPENEFIPGAGTTAQVCLSTPGEVSVRLLWTGDTHGQLRPIYHREYYSERFLTAYGLEKDSVEAYFTSQVNFLELAKQYGKVGGYAQLATLINQERSQYPDRTLLLDSGDAWYGSAIAMRTDGRAVVEVMNAMGYDAMTLHWEFNLGQEKFLERVSESNFAVLAQNLVDTDFGDRVLPPSIVREMGGYKIAVVGQAYPFSLLTTEDRDATPGFRLGYQDIELQEEVDRVRTEEGAEIVILLSHMGYEQDKVMAGNLTGVDVIVGAHSHDILWQPEQVGNTLLLQGGSHGKFLGKMDLEIQNGKISACNHQLIPVLADRIEPDPQIHELVNTLYAPYEDEFKEVIGETISVLYRRSLFGGPSDSFTTRAYKEIVGGDVGCSGGWRFGSTILPGPITVEDVYNAFNPTPSPVYKVKLKGSLMRTIMENSLDNVFNPDPLLRLGGDLTRCTGVKADLNRDAPREQRTSNLTVNGDTFDPDRDYIVGTSAGRTQYQDPNATATSRPAVEELVDYIKNAGVLELDPIQVYSEK